MEKETIDFEKMESETAFPQECEQSEKELESISDESVVTQYAIINMIVILLIGLITAVAFVVLTDSEKVDDISNPLNFKSFMSGKFSSNLEKSYVKKLPFPYALKNGESVIKFAFGVGNDLEIYKRQEEIVLVDDQAIEDERQEAEENEELSFEELQQTEKTTTTTKATKKTTKKKTETGSQRTTTEETEDTGKLVTKQSTTSLTTTNNDPPEVMITTTIPPTNAGTTNE